MTQPGEGDSDLYEKEDEQQHIRCTDSSYHGVLVAATAPVRRERGSGEDEADHRISRRHI